jgi:hypothetical protein
MGTNVLIEVEEVKSSSGCIGCVADDSESLCASLPLCCTVTKDKGVTRDVIYVVKSITNKSKE